MYENVVIESCADVLPCQEVRGVCAGAAHQIRMINRALRDAAARLLPVPLFVSVCSVCAGPPLPSLSLTALTFSTCTVLAPGMKPKHDGKCAA